MMAMAAAKKRFSGAASCNTLTFCPRYPDHPELTSDMRRSGQLHPSTQALGSH